MGIVADSTDRIPVRAVAAETPTRVAFRPDPKILQAIDSREEGNEFYYDESLRPLEMTYEWKRLTFGGKEDTQYQSKLAAKGWKPVPASRHPEVGTESNHDAYRDVHKNCIIVGGQILMERHVEYTKRARQAAEKLNDSQIGAQAEKVQGGESPIPKKYTKFERTYDSGQEIDA